MTARRPAALLAALVLATGCGGTAPTASPVTPPPSAVAASALPSGPASTGAQTCQPGAPGPLRLSATPPAGHIAGLTSDGRVIVAAGKVPGVADTLALWDRSTGVVTTVVHRPSPASAETATSQISGASGDQRWVVWEESGFVLEHADWTMWAADRSSGEVFRLASFTPGADGTAPPGWASRISLDGDTAAWDSPFEVKPGDVEPRVYVADLAARTVRRIDSTAARPSVVGGIVHAVVPAGQAGGVRLAQPVEMLPDGSARPIAGIAPAVITAHAASLAGTVVLTVDHVPTQGAEDTVSTAVAAPSSGIANSFRLGTLWHQAVAGSGFLAWADQQSAWILPTGQAQPGDLQEDPDGVELYAAGPWLAWVHGYDNAAQILEVSCRAAG